MSPPIEPQSLKGGSIAGPLKPENAVLCCPPIEKPAQRKQHVPRGLQNVGNTCYSNAVLQCLLSTALSDVLLHRNAAIIFRRYSSNPNLLVEGSASAESDASDGDMLPPLSPASREKRHKGRFDERMQNTCEWLTKELTDITRDYVRVSRPAHKRTSSPSLLASLLMGGAPSATRRDQDQVVVDPGTITRHPDRLNKCLRPYQQEDAHEFLRSLLSTLVMNGHNRKLSSLFDGLLESAVRCQSCDHSSLTRDRYMDLSLDIDGVKTLRQALDRFTATEILDGDNKVFCDECACKRTVTKTLRLATAPSILVCHLKRFAMNQYGQTRRLNNHVQFPLRLEIGDFMSRVNQAKPPPYELVGVLVHKGRTCDSGHYLAFIKSGEQWFKANDSEVTPVDVDVVLSQQAYVLFYEVAEMRNKEGFTTPHAYRLPHPNLAQPVLTASDDHSVPSNASTVVSDDDDENDAGGACYNWLSTLVNDTLLLGDLCCQSLDVGHRSRKREDKPPHQIVVDDSTLSTWGSNESSNTLRRASRMCKSNSSGDLTHFTERGRTSYNPHPPVAPPRTLSFGRRSDPRGGGVGRIDPYSRRGRSNSEKRRKREGTSKLPPRPFHARRHSGVPPGGPG